MFSSCSFGSYGKAPARRRRPAKRTSAKRATKKSTGRSTSRARVATSARPLSAYQKFMSVQLKKLHLKGKPKSVRLGAMKKVAALWRKKRNM